jgi:hypothetical protein
MDSEADYGKSFLLTAWVPLIVMSSYHFGVREFELSDTFLRKNAKI